MPIKRLILALAVAGGVMGLMYLFPVALATFAGGTAGMFRVAAWPGHASECGERVSGVTHRAGSLARTVIGWHPGLWQDWFGPRTTPYHGVVLLAHCRPGDPAYATESESLLQMLEGIPADTGGIDACLEAENALQGLTPLHLTVMADRPDLTRWLLAAGADPRVPACGSGPAAGLSALELAERMGGTGSGRAQVREVLSAAR